MKRTALCSLCRRRSLTTDDREGEKKGQSIMSRVTTRSSSRKQAEEALEEEVSHSGLDHHHLGRRNSIGLEAIDGRDDDGGVVVSPLRSMQNLEDVTLTLPATNDDDDVTTAKKKKKQKTKKTPNFSGKKKKTDDDDDVSRGEGSALLRAQRREDDERMPQSTHKRWMDDDRSPIVTRGGGMRTDDENNNNKNNNDDDDEGLKLDFLDPPEEEEEEEEEEGVGREAREETYENVDATEEILARVNARNLTWHKQTETAKFYGGVVEFGQQQAQMMGTLMNTPGFNYTAHRGIPPTPLANTAVPWPNENTNENMNTEAFLNNIASFRGEMMQGDDDKGVRGEAPLPRTPIFQHQRTPISGGGGGGGGGVGNIRTNSYHLNHTDAVMKANERGKQPPSSDEKLSAELRRTKTEILDCQDRQKRLRDTLVALREKEEKLYAKAAEMQRELLRRDPSKSLELGGATIFEAIPPLGNGILYGEKKASEERKENVAAEEAPVTTTMTTKSSEKEEKEEEENQLEEERRDGEAGTSSTARTFTSKISQTYDVHRSVLSMQFLDPSSWLAGQTSLLAASADDVIRLYAPDSRKPFALMRTEKGLTCVGTALNDRVAFCATKYGGISQIDLATGEKIGTVVQNFEQLRVNKSIECMVTSTTSGTNDNILVCGGEGSAIRVWDARCANYGAAPLTFHAPGARNVSSVALGGGESGHSTLLASSPTSGLFAFDLRVNSKSSSPGERGGGGQISRLYVPNFEKQPRWVNAKFCAGNEIFAIACDGDAATFEASGEFKATSAFAGVSAPFQMASPASSSRFSNAPSLVKTGGILEVSSDGEHVLVSTGEAGSGVQCFNTSTGAVVAAWDGDATSSPRSSREPIVPVACACWGHAGADVKEPFGQDAFALADAKGSVKVFGVPDDFA